MDRALLIAGAFLLLLTAGLHAAGVAMVAAWTEGFGEREAAAVKLVWLTNSIDWMAVALIWLMAAWKRRPEWTAAGAMVAIIPLAGGVGIARIDPFFFGGQMVLASVALALLGLLLIHRRRRPSS